MPSIRSEKNIIVETPRLELIAGNLEMVRAEISDRVLLSSLLIALVPADWPPEMDDLQMKELSARWFEENPDSEGWLCWYFILRKAKKGKRELIGIGGFKDKPEADGTVEIGYSILKRFQGSGYATEAAKGLVAWAFSHPDVRRVIAETPARLTASIRVLEKCGFVQTGPTSETETLWFELLSSAGE